MIVHPTPDADRYTLAPILYSGDPIESDEAPIEHGDGPEGRTGQTTSPGGTSARLRGLPLVFLSLGTEILVGGEPFAEETTDELANRPEVKAAERRAAQRNEPLPNGFLFFNVTRSEMKLVLWTDCGFTVIHQRLDIGAFIFSRYLRPGDRVPVEELVELLSGPRAIGAARSQVSPDFPALGEHGCH